MREQAYQLIEDNAHEQWWYQARDAILVDLLAKLDLPPDPMVIELGAGPGYLLSRLPYRRKAGLDIHLFPAWRELPATMIQADALRPPIRSACLDLILLLELLEHLPDDQAVMNQALTLLKPGGVMVLMVPAFNFLWSSLDEVGMHYRRYRASDIRQLLAEADVDTQILWSSYLNTFLFPPILMVRLLERLAKHSGIMPKDHVVGLKKPSDHINRLFRWIFLKERGLIGRIRLPWGVSFLAVIRRNIDGLSL